MTDEEALALKPDDRVLIPTGAKRLSRARVCRVDSTPAGGVVVVARQEGVVAGGVRGYSEREFSAYLVRAMPRGDSLTANVYADWLDENYEPRAAAKLRAAFPMSDGEG